MRKLCASHVFVRRARKQFLETRRNFSSISYELAIEVEEEIMFRTWRTRITFSSINSCNFIGNYEVGRYCSSSSISRSQMKTSHLTPKPCVDRSCKFRDIIRDSVLMSDVF
uniref:(northern house mosquito) hypothetical protein n=1 Tax=Culex pipiens TaxID=7175 RepID=A0A8D8FKN5_CULPI